MTTQTNHRTLGEALTDVLRKEAKRKSRRKKVRLAKALISGVLTVMFNGLWLMLAAGVVHHEWIPACPTIGYGWAVLLVALLRAALNQRSVKGGDRG